jgi:hypothetical protein
MSNEKYLCRDRVVAAICTQGWLANAAFFNQMGGDNLGKMGQSTGRFGDVCCELNERRSRPRVPS